MYELIPQCIKNLLGEVMDNTIVKDYISIS